MRQLGRLGVWYPVDRLDGAGIRRLLRTVMVLLLIALFHHIALGLRVVVEDYVHSDRAKIPTVVAIRFVCFALVVAGIFATVRIAFDG
jgi:succinate dehydrogenase / fumarate reductase membrane anchor subunit